MRKKQPRLRLVTSEPKEGAARRRGPSVRTLPAIDARRVERAFAEMAGRIADGGAVAEVQRSLLTILFGLLQPKACFLTRHAPDRDVLQVTAVRGRNDARIAAVKPGEGAAGRAFQTASVVRESQVVAAPLLGRGQPFGALVVIDPRYSVTDDLMRALAAQVEAGTEVARLRDEGVRRTKDLQTAVAGLKALEKTREELLANVSHDLKNPLTTIKAALSLLRREPELSERQEKSLAVVDRQADRLLRMINDLLLVSRLQSGKMELADKPFGLKALTDEVLSVLSTLAAQAKVTLAIARGSTEVFVRGDRDRLHEAIFNLVENAIHHSPSNGRVEVRIAAAEAGLAQLSVRDFGIGISEKDLKHIFDTFYRAKSPGKARRTAGLGLPITAKIVHLHGGRIEAQSKLGEGSTFQIFLPMFAGAVEPAEVANAPRAGGIVIVEDDADCREVLSQVLEMEGYRVAAVSSATEAKSLLSHIRPGLVLLDLRLSEEDGMSVLHFIRESPQLADVVVYIVSGAREVASLSSGRGIDRIDGFFEKPLQIPKVLETVASVVRPTRRLSPES